MEAATLNSPQCKAYVVSPVQKSLSLPSYARAGGEGIDHRIIFAALEQKERVRRKSRIFAKEPKKQNNLFCLPIKSSNKCRETSLSSDTSCSSLEYQKPSKTKKEEAKSGPKEAKILNGFKPPALKETKSSEVEPKYDFATAYKQEQTSIVLVNGSATNANIHLTGNVESSSSFHRLQQSHFNDDKSRNSLRVVKGLPDGMFRSGIGSSGDSMERSSRSSSDSLSRKERMVALKARVEAQREKYGAGSSSEDEQPHTGVTITRYNSDDFIHRTVRDVKSKSSRMEKRMRRRSQDEWALRRAARKQNISLYIAPGENIFDSYHTNEEPECKTDFCPSPQFPELLKKNYFSDFPTRENVTRFVQARIKCIENEEIKRRNEIGTAGKSVKSSSDKDNRNKSLTQLQNIETAPPEKPWEVLNHEVSKPPSPSPKSSQAPTPPPRSPKSLTFLNKAFMQHQNASYLRQENRSLERKPLFEANIRSGNKSLSNASEESTLASDAIEKRKIRELISSRRKTCSNFSFLQDLSLENATTPIENHEVNKQSVLDHEYPLYGIVNGKGNDFKGSFTSSDNYVQREISSSEAKVNMLKNKWNEMEHRREMQFNSLESKKKNILPSWIKRKGQPEKHDTCLCSGITGDKQNCICVPKGQAFPSGSPHGNQLKMFDEKYSKAALNLPMRSSPSNRLSKSEANITAVIQPKIRPYNLKKEELSIINYQEIAVSREKELRNKKQEQQSATANLESAMEELESVYQSLKFSSDNISEKTSLSNVSDEDYGLSYRLIRNKLNQHHDALLNQNDACPAIKPYTENTKIFNAMKDTSPNLSTTLIASSPKSAMSESICIDELFNDLTQQLDFEQKLLKESRELKIHPLSASNSRSVLDSKTYQNHPSSLDSIVSIRKELYNNLYKSSEDKYTEKPKDIVPLEANKIDLAKKKHKAVRSLSANISCLMNAANENSGIKNSLTNIDYPHNVSSKISSPLDNTIQEPSSIRNRINSPLAFDRGEGAFTRGSETPSSNGQILSQKPSEIRQIRVSMDTGESKPKPVSRYTENNSFSRLTSAVCQPQNKQLLPKSPEPQASTEASKTSATIDVLDEAALEDLLKSLMIEVPDKQEGKHITPTETVASTPVGLPAGYSENVIFKRNFCLTTMDACMSSNSKNGLSKLETSCNKGQKDLIEAQKINNTSQNNNAHLKTSFIPVFARKNDGCHILPKERKENEAKSNPPEVPTSQLQNVLSSFSPPYTHKNVIDNEMLAARNRSHVRRHSVGFEDITSATYCFGRNFTNDKRFQTVAHNPNVSSTSVPDYGNQLTQSEPVVKASYGKQEAAIPTNHNEKIPSPGNENETTVLGNDKPLLQRFEKLKDKSFKRKSSLNRIDFIPILSKDKLSDRISKCDREQRNSSSDENNLSRPLQKLSQAISKRKHSSSPVAGENAWVRKSNEVALQHENTTNSTRSKVLPRFNPLKIRNRKINYTNASHFEKLSYSAGELESLTSDRTNNGKTCLSAQEFDGKDNRLAPHMYRNARSTDNPLKKSSQVPTGIAFAKNTSKNCNSVAETCDIASQNYIETTSISCHSFNSKDTSEQSTEANQHGQTFINHYDNVPYICEKEIFPISSSDRGVIEDQSSAVEVNGIHLEEKQLFNSEASADIEENTNKIQCLEISTENLECTALEDDEDLLVYDPERRPSSILRKTYFEEKRELHSILKPTPDEKLSRTPPSILKHRESSEEKEVWPQPDLHSILKKSTSEDESYNSNPDIRPILKNNVSTDEESSGGTSRPRPILKKRTSFSEECSYACYASGELKPILKKISISNMEDQPRPILKTRRKSEDGRATMEFVTGARPRAYSADMGVKSNHEMRFSNEDIKKDFSGRKCDQHDL